MIKKITKRMEKPKTTNLLTKIRKEDGFIKVKENIL